uniref:Uncharacterized protein n=1 Tax=Rhizophora mucronata TaxID=61149 RepID=A0A2P2PWA4_RHIMU
MGNLIQTFCSHGDSFLSNGRMVLILIDGHTLCWYFMLK